VASILHSRFSYHAPAFDIFFATLAVMPHGGLLRISKYSVPLPQSPYTRAFMHYSPGSRAMIMLTRFGEAPPDPARWAIDRQKSCSFWQLWQLWRTEFWGCAVMRGKAWGAKTNVLERRFKRGRASVRPLTHMIGEHCEIDGRYRDDVAPTACDSPSSMDSLWRKTYGGIRGRSKRITY
jgi:hypothetical protein